MKFTKIKGFTLALVVGGTALTVIYGLDIDSLIIISMITTNPLFTFKDAFIDNWFFGVGIIILGILVTSIYYGEKQKEITISQRNV